MNKPNTKPNNPNFSSGPTSKRPGWDISVLSNALTGRSHRSVECKERLKEAIDKSKDILKLPDDYLLGIMPGSNTGALEAAMWCLLGKTGVDILAWENFGKDWVIDAISELKLDNLNIHEEDYGKLPDLSKVNFDNDVIFTWNGTTSGVKVPNGDWIPEDRKGLTICDGIIKTSFWQLFHQAADSSMSILNIVNRIIFIFLFSKLNIKLKRLI